MTDTGNGSILTAFTPPARLEPVPSVEDWEVIDAPPVSWWGDALRVVIAIGAVVLLLGTMLAIFTRVISLISPLKC